MTRPAWTFAIVSIALFMVVLDNLVVTNALLSIREDLGATIQSLEWTVNAYTLSFAALLLTAAAFAGLGADAVASCLLPFVELGIGRRQQLVLQAHPLHARQVRGEQSNRRAPLDSRRFPLMRMRSPTPRALHLSFHLPVSIPKHLLT